MTNEPENISVVLDDLATIRAAKDIAERAYKDASTAFDIEMAAVRASRDGLREQEKQLYARAVELATLALETDGDKKPDADVTFRQEKSLEYDADTVAEFIINGVIDVIIHGYEVDKMRTARTNAISHLMAFFKLNTDVIEDKFAKSDFDLGGLIREVKRYKPTIATKLGHRLLK